MKRMRAIDADALIDDLKHDVAVDQDSLDYEELTDSNRENIQFDKDCKQNAIDLLQHAPTIEPERKKGMWIPVTNGRGGFECDQCHNYAPSYQDGVEWLSGFCPNCGAEMTEESEEPKRCDTCKHEKEPWTSGCSDCFDYELWEEKDETGRFTTED